MRRGDFIEGWSEEQRDESRRRMNGKAGSIQNGPSEIFQEDVCGVSSLATRVRSYHLEMGALEFQAKERVEIFQGPAITSSEQSDRDAMKRQPDAIREE